MALKFTVIAIMVMALGISNANAQQIKQTAKNQKHRIRQGVKSGELTRSETRNLVKQEKEIHQEVKAAKADGTVTGAERREIKQDQRQTSRAIYRKKHNRRDRN